MTTTILGIQCFAQSLYHEMHRPQIHFSPKEKWMNDPNGMVYLNGQYHLFFQYYPDSTIWGPMHWGHAISKDLIHWDQQPVALFPDSLGYIFSGSIVADFNNTSGFGTGGRAPLVAIFTHHDPIGQRTGKSTYQNQSIAYSLDEGKTWKKYNGNPVLKNPGIRDFRDPKVMWYEGDRKWIMTLATRDRVTFYSSKDLKSWDKESEFGQDVGAHGGVWECPDLFPLNYKGKQVWVLLVSINPGAPNGGSATQYFTGQFDGKTFRPFQTDTRWIDYGPDNYAGVTWSNTGKRKIFLGWMSNWKYARVVPTNSWRSAMTIPRDLSIEKINEKYLLTSKPVHELNSIVEHGKSIAHINARNYNLTEKIGKIAGPSKLQINTKKAESFSLTFSNRLGERVIVGYDKHKNHYFIDRTKSGKVDFYKDFASIHTVPRLTDKDELVLTLIIDNASIELIADNGLSIMTEIFFPNEILSDIQIQSSEPLLINSLRYNEIKSIWKSS